MATVTLDIGDGPRMEYSRLCERVAPFLHNRIPEGLLLDTVRDAVVQVCRDLDFLRHTFELAKNAERDDRTYTMVHQGYSMGNPLLAWDEKKEREFILPNRIFDDIDVHVHRTVIHVPALMHEMVRGPLFFMLSLAPARDSTDFPAVVYEQEAQLLILCARSFLMEFDPKPVPFAQYKERAGRAYTRYVSNLGEESVGMFI